MTINVHPIFVHFPIALLTIYALFELLYFKQIRNLAYTFYIKAFLVVAGSAAAFVTLQTGEWAAEGLESGPMRQLIETHSNWADIATGIFTVLAASYAIAWLNRSPGFAAFVGRTPWLRGIWLLLTKLQKLFIETPLVVILALGGLAAITITGALGGSMVYGPDVDPVVSFIYHLLIK